MHPADLQIIGEELAIKWNDGSETFLPFEALRRACPCASCKGEMDVMGNVYKGPDIKLTAAAFRLTRMVPVGGYALQITWGDGHNSGIYSFDYLRNIPAA